jgi:hypothetical protein
LAFKRLAFGSKKHHFCFSKSSYMKNRISHSVTPEQINAFQKAMATANQILDDMLASAQLTELNSSQNMGTEEGWLYVQRGYAAAEKYPKLVDPEELDVREYKKDLDLATFVLEARKSTKAAEERANVIGLLVGKDLMEATHYMRQRAQSKRTVNRDYGAISDELNRLFERRRGRADDTRKTNELIQQLRDQKS